MQLKGWVAPKLGNKHEISYSEYQVRFPQGYIDIKLVVYWLKLKFKMTPDFLYKMKNMKYYNWMRDCSCQGKVIVLSDCLCARYYDG